MLIGLTLLILAFAWLLYETKFLSIRLPVGKPRVRNTYRTYNVESGRTSYKEFTVRGNIRK